MLAQVVPRSEFGIYCGMCAEAGVGYDTDTASAASVITSTSDQFVGSIAV